MDSELTFLIQADDGFSMAESLAGSLGARIEPFEVARSVTIPANVRKLLLEVSEVDLRDRIYEDFQVGAKGIVYESQGLAIAALDDFLWDRLREGWIPADCDSPQILSWFDGLMPLFATTHGNDFVCLDLHFDAQRPPIILLGLGSVGEHGQKPKYVAADIAAFLQLPIADEGDDDDSRLGTSVGQPTPRFVQWAASVRSILG